MKTHSGNNGKLLADIGLITFNTLKKYEIPFDEIYFGKPYANVYVDDLAMNCFDDMEKGIGYYMDKIEPRDFNKLVNNSIETYKKYCVFLIFWIWGWIPKGRRHKLCSKTSYMLRSASFAISGDVQKPSKKLWFSLHFLSNY